MGLWHLFLAFNFFLPLTLPLCFHAAYDGGKYLISWFAHSLPLPLPSTLHFEKWRVCLESLIHYLFASIVMFFPPLSTTRRPPWPTLMFHPRHSTKRAPSSHHKTEDHVTHVQTIPRDLHKMYSIIIHSSALSFFPYTRHRSQGPSPSLP